MTEVFDDVQSRVDVELLESFIRLLRLREHGQIERAGEQIYPLDGVTVLLERLEALRTPVTGG